MGPIEIDIQVFNAVKFLESKGLYVIINGCFDVSPIEAAVYAVCEDQFFALKEEVSIERYRLWKDWRENAYKCRGKNRKNKPCKAWVLDSDGVSPKSFKPGWSDRCLHCRKRSTQTVDNTLRFMATANMLIND